MLLVVTRSPIKAIASAGNGLQKTGVNRYNVTFVNSGLTKYVFTFKSDFYLSVGRKQRILYFTNLTVDSEIMMKWRVLTLLCINMC